MRAVPKNDDPTNYYGGRFTLLPTNKNNVFWKCDDREEDEEEDKEKIYYQILQNDEWWRLVFSLSSASMYVVKMGNISQSHHCRLSPSKHFLASF